MKLKTRHAITAFLIIATPLYAESCALASGGDNRSRWLHCPKAKQCPPTAMVERDIFEMKTGWLSTANVPTCRNVRTTS
jgi:hypothetical protein